MQSRHASREPLAATQRPQANDENLPPNTKKEMKPDDQSRARFGFKKPRAALGASADQSLNTTANQSLNTSAQPIGDTYGTAIDLSSLLEAALEESQSIAPLINYKFTTEKLDYKNRMAELVKFNDGLKEALKKEGHRRKTVREAISGAQEEVDQFFANLSDGCVTLRAELAQMKQEAECQGARADKLDGDLMSSRQKVEELNGFIAETTKTAKALNVKHTADKQELEKIVAQTRNRADVQVQEAKEVAGRDQDALQTQLTKTTEDLELVREQLGKSKESEASERAACHLQLREKDALLAAERQSAKDQLKEAEENAGEERSNFQNQLREKDQAAAIERAGLKKELSDKDEAASSERVLLQKEVQEGQKVMRELRAARFSQLQEQEKAAEEAREDQARLAAQARDEADKSFRSQLQSAQAAWEVDRDHLKTVAADNEVAMQALRKELLETQRAVATEKDGGAKLAAEAMDQEKQLDAVRAQLEDTQRAKATSAAEATKLQAKLTSLQTELAQVEQLKSGLEASALNTDSQLAQVRTELAAEQRCNHSHVSETTILREQLATTQAEVKDARRSNASLEQSKEALLVEMLSKLETAEAQTAAQSADAANAQAQLEAARAEVTDALSVAGAESGAKVSLAESVRDLRGQLGSQAEIADVLRKSLLEDLERHKADVCKLQASLEQKKQEAESLAREKRLLELEFGCYKENNSTTNTQQVDTIADLKKSVDMLVTTVQSNETDIAMHVGHSLETQSHISSLELRVANSEAQRRELHNTVQNLKGNIRVMCRVRPRSEGEVEEDDAVGHRDDGKVSITNETSHGSEVHAWAFDKVFRQDSQQPEIFAEMDGLVQSALDGFKVCLFAYGQTGSGKTFTMQGTTDPRLWGLIPRSLTKIFEQAEAMGKQGWTWTLDVSFLEVYNEQLRDLLRDDKQPDALPLTIQHSDAWGSIVVNATQTKVDSMDQINSVMAKASKQRAVGSTDMNAQSSRSHSMFALYLHGTNTAKEEQLHGALHLVDLAGSERLDKSGATGDRLKETQNINRSLACLTDVFVAKSENRKHVPFRNSKLTHLMEPCLSGEGKTLMIVNVSPETSNSNETLCSLRFAGRVSQCNTGGKPKRGATALVADESNTSSGYGQRPASAAQSASASTTRPRSAASGSASGSAPASRTTPASGRSSVRR